MCYMFYRVYASCVNMSLSDHGAIKTKRFISSKEIKILKLKQQQQNTRTHPTPIHTHTQNPGGPSTKVYPGTCR